MTRSRFLTRRLIIEHEFFVWEGSPDTSPLLKTKGKNLQSGDTFFTTLQTLYGMNEKLLLTAERDHAGFARREYKQFRPSEEELDRMFGELMVYWEAILAELGVLRSEPGKMRAHDAEPGDSNGLSDHLLFWPIGTRATCRCHTASSKSEASGSQCASRSRRAFLHQTTRKNRLGSPDGTMGWTSTC